MLERVIGILITRREIYNFSQFVSTKLHLSRKESTINRVSTKLHLSSKKSYIINFANTRLYNSNKRPYLSSKEVLIVEVIETGCLTDKVKLLISILSILKQGPGKGKVTEVEFSLVVLTAESPLRCSIVNRNNLFAEERGKR